MNSTNLPTTQKQKFSVAITTEGYKNLINNTLGDPERSRRFIASITSAVAVNIAVFYLFNKENDGLSNIVGLLFFAMVVFTIGSVIKMIFMIILAATNSKAIRPTESEGQET